MIPRAPTCLPHCPCQHHEQCQNWTTEWFSVVLMTTTHPQFVFAIWSMVCKNNGTFKNMKSWRYVDNWSSHCQISRVICCPVKIQQTFGDFGTQRISSATNDLRGKRRINTTNGNKNKGFYRLSVRQIVKFGWDAQMPQNLAIRCHYTNGILNTTDKSLKIMFSETLNK